MPNFSIKFSYSKDQLVFHKTAIVRASSPDKAKDKLVSILLHMHEHTFESFAIEKISVSSYNYVVV